MSGRLLIAAGQAAGGTQDLPSGIRELVSAAEEVLVLSPTLPSRFEWLASATDRAREQADERLHTVLGHVSELGTDAHGEVGADDPLLALEDAVSEFAPDHILIGLRSDERAGWQEQGLLDKVIEHFTVPITVFQLHSE